MKTFTICSDLTVDYFLDFVQQHGMKEAIEVLLNDERVTAWRRFSDFLKSDRLAGYLRSISPDELDEAVEALKQLRRDERSDDSYWGHIGHGIVECLVKACKARNDGRLERILVEALQRDPDERVRHDAAWALGRIGRQDESIVDALLAALTGYSRSVRSAAAFALGWLGCKDKKVVDALVEVLERDKDDESVGYRAAVALAQLSWQDENIVEGFLGMLEKGETPTVRRNAAEALSCVGEIRLRQGGNVTKIVVALYERLIVEDNWKARHAVERALSSLIFYGSLVPTKPAIQKRVAKPGVSVSLSEPDFNVLWRSFEQLSRDRSLVYVRLQVLEYHSMLWSNKESARHFVILAGPAGTGKTRLAQVYAAAVLGCSSLEDLNMHPQFCMVAVRPEWTDARDLLGYYNPIAKRYITTPVLEMLLDASRHPDKPYFLVLDEMNIAHVEYYFSDFLSGMESGAEIFLHDEADLKIPKSIKIPSNLFVTGTINVDETTHEISPKVLDRAYILELGPDWDEYSRKSPIKNDPHLSKTFNELMTGQGVVREAANILQKAGLGFGYRTPWRA